MPPYTNINENDRPDANTTLIGIPDGTSNTMFVGEKAMQTGQYSNGQSGSFDESFFYGGRGGAARSRNTTTFNTGQPAPAIVQDSPTVTHGNRWGSPHPAGALFVLCDGSVRTVRFGLDPIPAMLPNDGSVNPLQD